MATLVHHIAPRPCIALGLARRLAAGALIAALGLLAGCVDSEAPILTDAQPLFGKEARLHLYGLHDGKAHDFERVTFRWNGTRYVPVGRNKSGIDAFTLHPFENGDWIAQTANARGKHVEYALMHTIADGVHLVSPIDEDDADEATRAQCQRLSQFSCRVSTRDQLMAFARATAAKHHSNGGLVVEVAKP